MELLKTRMIKIFQGNFPQLEVKRLWPWCSLGIVSRQKSLRCLLKQVWVQNPWAALCRGLRILLYLLNFSSHLQIRPLSCLLLGCEAEGWMNFLRRLRNQENTLLLQSGLKGTVYSRGSVNWRGLWRYSCHPSAGMDVTVPPHQVPVFVYLPSPFTFPGLYVCSYTRIYTVSFLIVFHLSFWKQSLTKSRTDWFG